MPVDSKHSEYKAREGQWLRCRDAISGTDAIKKAGILYLPQLGGQNVTQYEAYKKRALYFGASGRTVQGLAGAVFRKDYVLDYPEGRKDLLDDITSEGADIRVLLRTIVDEVLSVGRTGVLVDVGRDGEMRAYIAQYDAENIINWRTDRVNGQQMLTMVVLSETYEDDTSDEYERKQKTQYRVLRLDVGDASRTYRQVVFRKNEKEQWVQFEEVTPTRSGVPLDFIPFQFINADHDTPETVKPPLLDLVDVNVSHYRTSADLEHGAHYTALPTPVLMGFDPKKKWEIGSGVAWVTSNVQGDAKYLEYTGQGLDALRTLKRDKELMMAILGARMLEEQKRAAEAAETHKLRASGESGALAALVDIVSGAMTTVLKWQAEWSNVSPELADKISLVLNSDFIGTRLTAQELTALMQMWQSGAISQDTFLENLKVGEILPDGRTIEQEKDLLELANNNELNNPDDNVTPIKRSFELVRGEDGKPTGIREA